MDITIPDGNSTGFGNKILCVDFGADSGLISIFPEMRDQTFTNLLAGVLGFFKLYRINSSLCQ